MITDKNDLNDPYLEIPDQDSNTPEVPGVEEENNNEDNTNKNNDDNNNDNINNNGNDNNNDDNNNRENNKSHFCNLSLLSLILLYSFLI